MVLCQLKNSNDSRLCLINLAVSTYHNLPLGRTDNQPCPCLKIRYLTRKLDFASVIIVSYMGYGMLILIYFSQEFEFVVLWCCVFKVIGFYCFKSSCHKSLSVNKVFTPTRTYLQFYVVIFLFKGVSD